MTVRSRSDELDDDGPDPDLLEERDFLLRSLEDLERERAAGDLSERDYVELRDQYTARAAQVLRAIERGGTLADARGGPSGRLARWIAVIVVVAMLGGYVVAGFAGERAPDQALTGSIETGPADDLARAAQLLAEGNAVGAVKLYDEVLRRDPTNPEALAYRGWVLHLAGLTDEGLVSIDKAIAAAPTYPDARFFKGVILYRTKNDPAAAIPELRAFLANDPPPDRVPAVEQLLREALAAAGQAPASSTTTAPPG